MCCEHMEHSAADVDRCRERASRLAPFHREIDTVHLHDPVARQQCVAETFGHHFFRAVSCRAQRACITVERCQHDRLACLQRNARRVRELLERDYIGVQLSDHGGHAIGIVASVSTHARVYVVSRNTQRPRRHHHPNSALVRWLDTATANWRINTIARSAATKATSSTAAPIVANPFDSVGLSSVWRSRFPKPLSAATAGATAMMVPVMNVANGIRPAPHNKWTAPALATFASRNAIMPRTPRALS